MLAGKYEQPNTVWKEAGSISLLFLQDRNSKERGGAEHLSPGGPLHGEKDKTLMSSCPRLQLHRSRDVLNQLKMIRGTKHTLCYTVQEERIKKL